MEIKPGKYRHFKGNLYEVIGVARHSETQEEMVVYRALYGEYGLWVRPAAMWTETCQLPGSRHGKKSQGLHPGLRGLLGNDGGVPGGILRHGGHCGVSGSVFRIT